jgi:hypothetical protein
MSNIDLQALIPNNVNLGDNRQLQRALEHWQPAFLNWWDEMGPSDFNARQVYLRTAVGVDASGWASYGYTPMPDYRWGIFLADKEEGRKIGFGDFMGKDVWQDVPGEYRSTSGIATMRDGRLLLWDTGNWRINVYGTGGEALTQWLTPSGSSGSSVATFSRALLVDTSGLVITRRMIIIPRDFRNRPTVWLRYRADGTPVDTLRAPAAPREVPTLVASAGNAMASTELPFAPKRLVALSPLGYFVAGYPDRYAFEIHEPGKPVVSVRRDVRAEPVSRTEQAEARRQVEESLRRTDPAWSWNGPDIPDVKPLYSDIQVGLDGRIWIAIAPEVTPRVGSTSSSSGVGNPGVRRPPAQANREPPRPALYDVFEPDGRYLGRVQVPAGVSSVVRRGNQVWAVAFDADDVPRIKRYRIAWR